MDMPTPEAVTSALPLLPTAVVGSYSVPEWLERLKTDYHQHRISGGYMREIHEVAIKAAIKDQERAGIDFVSDGELRRDNDIDYLLARIPGIDIQQRAKSYFYDYYDATVTHPLPEREDVPLGLAVDYAFTRACTDHSIKFSFTGPFSLSRRIKDAAYSDPGDLVRSLATLLNAEAHRLIESGARLLQIDEPFLAGYPEQVALAVEGINLVTKNTDADWALHVCYGNRYARPSWEGHYDFLFPHVLDADVGQLVLEFARKGYEDLDVISRYEWDRSVGLGVIDVKSEDVEDPELIADRIRQALRVVPAEKLFINPDCGLRHLSPATARAKLTAMTEGAGLVRRELEDQRSKIGPPADDGVRDGLARSEP